MSVNAIISLLDGSGRDAPSSKPGAPTRSEAGRRSNGAGAPMASIAGGAYDGARVLDRELVTWAPPIRSADGDLLADKLTLDVRGRDLARNDGLMANAVKLHKDSVVGEQYLLSAKPNARVLGLDETWATEFSEEVEALFDTLGGSLDCWLDVTRKMTFTDMVRLGVGIDSMGGEIIASVEWVRDRDPRRIVNTAINFIDADRLSNPHGTFNRRDLRNGVQRDDYGRPLGYWFRRAHPGDYWNYAENWFWDYVAARKPWGRQQIIHLFENLRPDQSRGVSAMVTTLKEGRMTRKFRDIVLQNAVVAATFAATIESELPSEVVFNQLGQSFDGDMTGFITQYGNSYLSAIAAYAAGKTDSFMLDGAKIPHLYPGSKLQLRPAGSPGGIGETFEKSMLRYIATSLGLGAEEFSGDYSETNYSSIKAGAAVIRRGALARKARTADRFANTVYRLVMEEFIGKGIITSMPRNAPSFYEGLNADAYCNADWIGASTGQINELDETQAAMLRISNGLSTWEQECAKLGQDWRGVMRQRAREKAFMTKLGIWDDYMTMNGAGATNTKNALGAKSKSGGDSPGDGKPADKKDAST